MKLTTTLLVLFFAAVLDFALDLRFAVLGFLVVIVDLRDLR